MKRMTVILSALALALGVLAVGAWRSGFFQIPPDKVAAARLPVPPKGVPVLDNSCSAGYVTFTFDDGPDVNTLMLVSELKAEHVQGVFFVIGEKAAANPAIIKAENKNGFVIGDHTWDHHSLTGQDGPTNKMMTDAQVRSELTQAINAITATGLPRPKLWRAPYDDVTAHQAAVAKSLGLQLVMSYGAPGGGIVDSQDWTGNSPQSIANYIENGDVSNNQTGAISQATPAEIAHATPANGYDAGDGGTYTPGLSAGSILSFHDGLPSSVNTIKAIPLIVKYLNAHHLCSTTVVPANSTGGDFDGSPAGGNG